MEKSEKRRRASGSRRRSMQGVSGAERRRLVLGMSRESVEAVRAAVKEGTGNDSQLIDGGSEREGRRPMCWRSNSKEGGEVAVCTKATSGASAGAIGAREMMVDGKEVIGEERSGARWTMSREE